MTNYKIKKIKIKGLIKIAENQFVFSLKYFLLNKLFAIELSMLLKLNL